MMENLPDIAIAMNSLAENAVLQQGGGPSIEQGRPLHSVSVSQRSAQGMRSAGIGAAVVGALAEDSISPGIGILLTVLPETLVIFALVALFV